jgi:hypothetical protein
MNLCQLTACVPSRLMAQSWVRSASVWCRVQAEGGSVHELLGRPFAGRAVRTSPAAAVVAGMMRSRQVVGCTASTSPVVWCRDEFRHQNDVTPFRLSPTNVLLPSYRQITSRWKGLVSYLAASGPVDLPWRFQTWYFRALFLLDVASPSCEQRLMPGPKFLPLIILNSSFQPGLPLVSCQIW